MALATLVVDLILKAGGFESDIGRASKTAQKRMKEIEREAKRLGVAMGAALAAGATAFAYALKAAVDRADELYNAAQKIGINVEALSALEYAAKQAGVEMEQLQTGLAKLIKFQTAAAQGSKSAAETFAAFGIALKDDVTGGLRDTEAVLGDFADVFAALEDGPEKVALALRVFGKSGAELIPFLNEGRDGIKELTDEARRLGIVIDEETGRKADQFNDQLDTLKATAQGVATQLASNLLPDLIELTNNLQEAAESGEAARKIEEVFHVIAIAGQIVGAVIQGVTDYVQALTSKGISAFHQWSGLLKVLRLDIKGAREEFAIAQREEDAAAFAARETFGNIGRAFGGAQGVAAKPVNWIDAPTAAELKSRRDPAETQAAAQRLFAEEQKKANAASRAAAEAKRAAAEAAREQAQREKELQDELERVADASKEFTRRLEDLAVAHSPLAQAALQFKRDMEDLAKLAKDGERSAEDLAAAEALLREEFARTTKEIEAREHPEKKLLEDMQAQLDLLHLQTQAERDRAEFMLEHANATQEAADAYVRLSDQIRETQEHIAAADQLRDHFADFFSSIIDGSKSAKEAFNDLAKSILADIARMIAKRWVEKLFGQYGTTGEGSSGAGIIGALFGGGNAMGNAFAHGEVTPFAMGGVFTRPTVFPMARGMGLMGEAGPEAVMPLSRMANGKLGVSSGGRATTINVMVDGATTRETAQQVATKVAQTLKFAGRAL